MSRIARQARPAPAHKAPLVQRVFASLGDGQAHSGEALAAEHGVTRSAIWKTMRQLRELGLQTEATRPLGYRLLHATEALESGALRRALPAAAVARLGRLDVAWSLPSTNTALLERSAPAAGRFDVLLAEHQSGGRGRRGRAWLTPLGGSLCFSVALQFAEPPAGLSALPLCVGVSMLESLQRAGATGLALKWPNDLVAAHGTTKLGGILTELRAEAGGPAQVVIGVGLNLRLPLAARRAIERLGNSPGDLAGLGLGVGRRNALAAAVIGALLLDLQRFAAQGPADFLARWRRHDALRDAPVVVVAAGHERSGIARGVDADGALLFEDATGGRAAVLAGEVSLRRELDGTS